MGRCNNHSKRIALLRVGGRTYRHGFLARRDAARRGAVGAPGAGPRGADTLGGDLLRNGRRKVSSTAQQDMSADSNTSLPHRPGHAPHPTPRASWTASRRRWICQRHAAQLVRMPQSRAQRPRGSGARLPGCVRQRSGSCAFASDLSLARAAVGLTWPSRRWLRACCSTRWSPRPACWARFAGGGELWFKALALSRYFSRWRWVTRS
jgi:hypothetical protein